MTAATTAPADLQQAFKVCPHLSPMTALVWREITRGAGNLDIARDHFISEDTVKTHIRRLFAKLEPGLTRPLPHGWTRTAAAMHGLRTGAFTLAPWQETRPVSLREAELMQLVADGGTYATVGEALGISPLTVKSHLARIAKRVGTGNKTIICTRLYRAGVIQ